MTANLCLHIVFRSTKACPKRLASALAFSGDLTPICCTSLPFCGIVDLMMWIRSDISFGFAVLGVVCKRLSGNSDDQPVPPVRPLHGQPKSPIKSG